MVEIIMYLMTHILKYSHSSMVIDFLNASVRFRIMAILRVVNDM